jgi:hypothetical protein
METSGQALRRGRETRAQRVPRLACGVGRPAPSACRGLRAGSGDPRPARAAACVRGRESRVPSVPDAEVDLSSDRPGDRELTGQDDHVLGGNR